MKFGAERMCMPSPSADQFVDAVKQTALANKRWVHNNLPPLFGYENMINSKGIMMLLCALSGSSSWKREFIH